MTYLKHFYSSLFIIINRRKDEVLLPSSWPELPLITIHRCQVCNKEQQQHQGNTMICLQCQADEEVARVIRNNPTSVSQICLFAMPFNTSKIILFY